MNTNHTDSVKAAMSIEEMVEKLAACRYTGNPKTSPSEENYKANLTIVLAQCLQAYTSQQVEEAVRKITSLPVYYRSKYSCDCSRSETEVEKNTEMVELEMVLQALTPNHQD